VVGLATFVKRTEREARIIGLMVFFINVSSFVNSLLFPGRSPEAVRPLYILVSTSMTWESVHRQAVKPRITLLYTAVRTSDRPTLPEVAERRRRARRTILIGIRPDAPSRRVPWRSL